MPHVPPIHFSLSRTSNSSRVRRVSTNRKEVDYRHVSGHTGVDLRNGVGHWVNIAAPDEGDRAQELTAGQEQAIHAEGADNVESHPHGPEDIYAHYADATGHSPPMRDHALLFWQSRNRYKSSRIVEEIATRYSELDLPVGVLVVDYKNQDHDGDFAPGKTCYPSVSALSSKVKSLLGHNTSLMFSFWPEVLTQAAEFHSLADRGCLINADLGGLAFDATRSDCRPEPHEIQKKINCKSEEEIFAVLGSPYIPPEFRNAS